MTAMVIIVLKLVRFVGRLFDKLCGVFRINRLVRLIKFQVLCSGLMKLISVRHGNY